MIDDDIPMGRLDAAVGRDPRSWSRGKIPNMHPNRDDHAEVLSDAKTPPKPEDSWGFHLLCDMSECNDKINSIPAVTKFFADLIDYLDMKELSPLMIKKVEGEDGRGISGVQMITTSSITFHSDDDKRSVYLDVFSCKNFDPKRAETFICNYFQPKRHRCQMIYRDAGLTGRGERQQPSMSR